MSQTFTIGSGGSEDQLMELQRQLDSLVYQKLNDVRHDIRAAIGRISGLKQHPALTVGDAAALIGMQRTLSDVEDMLERLQVERGNRHKL
jgi:hypothetical protein